MPDAHGGVGMPIGGVLATHNVVIPNAVGTDIGCGMSAIKTDIPIESVTSDILRKQLMREIRKQIPLGRGKHQKPQDESFMPVGFDMELLPVVNSHLDLARHQIGTLGGGNHFIELQRCTSGYLWIMLHSGSRGLGGTVGDHYDKIARGLNELWHSRVTPEMKLAFLPLQIPEAQSYWREMEYCISYAFANRKLMMDRICSIILNSFPDANFDPLINIAHNYAAKEHHFNTNVIVHRKGAVRARAGEIGIIPGSQGTASYIVEGLGSEESFFSSSHGAGRALSRSAACSQLSLSDEIARLESLNIVHAIRTQRDLEEAAGAYKDINEVMFNQRDLVKPLVELFPIGVIKG
jgi:tRNA-splicing ligase RtcB